MLDRFKKAYEHSPAAIKYLYAAIPFPLRMGRTYRTIRRLLKDSETWSQDTLKNYQNVRLRALLTHAYKNVPYYRKLFADIGVKPESLQDPAILIKIPTLTRTGVKQNYDNLIARNVPSHARHHIATGGTTAEPLGFQMSNSAYFEEWAFIHDIWSRVDFGHRDMRLGLREFPFSSDKCYYYDPLYNELRVSTLMMSDNNLCLCVQEARRLGTLFIHGYPSAISVLARYLEKTGQQIPSLHAVLAGSEPTFQWQRELFEKVLRCRVLTWYGQAERVILAGECKDSTHYHVYPQYGFLELMDEDGHVITEPGVVGEMVGTGFLNYAMPFIRYRTGDYAEYVGGRCSCGRTYPLLKSVVGRRKQDFLVGKDQQLVPATAFYVTDWTLFRNVREFQLEQHVQGKVVLEIVPNAEYSVVDEAGLLRAMTLWAGKALHFDIMTVDQVQRTARGKVPFLVQNLHLPNWTGTSFVEGSHG